jgi:starch synthase
VSALKILSVASEIYPLIKTGGLADVAGALPLALRPEGVTMMTLIPGYPAVMAALENREEVSSIPFLFGGSARLLAGTAANLDLFVLDAPHLYDRPGNPYTAPNGSDWPDNAFRFAALGKVAAATGRGLVPRFAPNVIHTHDWQAGLTEAYLHYGLGGKPATVATIHNLAYQGQFPATLLGALELPPEALTFSGIEHYGAIGYLKAALQLADRITTVSPTYALEIQRPETGMGFDGLLRDRSSRLKGILNGIDTEVWNPAADSRIAANYDAGNLKPRAVNKEVLQNALGLSIEPDTLVAGIISRLSWQKGLDLLLDNLPIILEENMQLAILGVGDPEMEARLEEAAETFPGRVGVQIGYDETLAHRIQAGADALLIPSRFEPCGLTQLCALRYGAVPVVSRVGGLADTIIDANEMALAAGVATGIQFAGGVDDGLALALRKTASLFRDKPAWRNLQARGMITDVSWRNPARRYIELYKEIAPGKPALDSAA